MKTYNRGSSIIIEVTFKIYTPFTGYTYFDPDIKTITVIDPEDVKKVDAETLVQVETGKYYYKVQSGVTWKKGTYLVQTNCEENNDTDVTIDPESFYLE